MKVIKFLPHISNLPKNPLPEFERKASLNQSITRNKQSSSLNQAISFYLPSKLKFGAYLVFSSGVLVKNEEERKRVERCLRELYEWESEADYQSFLEGFIIRNGGKGLRR